MAERRRRKRVFNATSRPADPEPKTAATSLFASLFAAMSTYRERAKLEQAILKTQKELKGL